MDYNTISHKVDTLQYQTEQVVITCLLQLFKWSVIILAMIIGVALGIALTVVRHAFAFLRVSLALAFSVNSKKQQAQEDEWDEDETSFQQALGGR